MKGILVFLTANYVRLIELVRSIVIGMRSLEKTIVMRYAIEPRMPPVRIHIDVLDESMAEAIPPEIEESNHIPMQPSRDGGQSDEAVQPIAVNNLIIPSPILPYIPSPIVGLDLHMEDGLEKQDEFLNNDLGMNHDDCNAGEFNVKEGARYSNERSITGSIRAHSVVNRTRTQFVHVPNSDNFSSAVVVADFTPITICHVFNCITYCNSVTSHENTPHGKALNSSKLLARAKYFGPIFMKFAFARGMQNIMYSKPSLTAPSSLSNFAFNSCTSKCSLDVAHNVEKYILINRLSTASAKWVDSTHFIPVIGQNSLIENLPRSSPTSNHKASPIPE
ncbi:hypothetical protein TIFTF001_025279 [Ficus carica]|uniref:Uncharacterized protein n=1 Tax=Ficus carica TaxID=3494 RepID=A0AA88AJK3_FICCA|nr:hypothetical protein TIFTF001_025279 [Ficus carica]